MNGEVGLLANGLDLRVGMCYDAWVRLGRIAHMPRKPALPPMIYRVEGMSDGRELRPRAFIDDFTGEAMPVVQDDRPTRVLPSGQELRDAHNRAETARKVAVIARHAPHLLGIKPKPMLTAPYVPGMRPIRTITVNGKSVAVYVKLDPIRRF